MKKILLSISCIASCFAFGQVQMNASIAKYFSGGALAQVDSTAYEYQFVGQGTMNSNKLVYDWNLDIAPFWYQPNLIVPFAQSRNYLGATSTSAALSARSSQITNAQTLPSQQIFMDATSSPFSKELYTYNAAGKRTSTVQLNYNGTSYDTTAKETWAFNSQNLQTVHNYFDFNAGYELMDTDTTYYDGSNKVTSKKGYYRNGSGGNLIYDYKSEAVYNGSTLQHVEVYFDTTGNGSAAPAKFARAAYNYTTGNPTRIDVLFYQGGILIPQPIFKIVYAYTNNIISRESQVDQNNDTTDIRTYDYYSTDLLSKVTTYSKNGGVTTKELEELFYYGPLTAELKEIHNLNVAVFPNPSTEFVTLQTEEKLNTVQIYNMNGQLMSSEKPVSNTIDVTHLSQGSYKMIVSTNKGQMNASFIKK